MQNFNWTKFTLKIAINAKKETLFNAWTKPVEIEKWFLQNCDYISDEKPIDKNDSAQKGNSYAWTWFLYAETESGKIIDVIPNEKFAFTFAGDCLVEVTFAEAHEHTIVELTQSNIPTDDLSKQNVRLGCNSGWQFYLVNLKSVFEGGLDLRAKDDRFPPYINS